MWGVGGFVVVGHMLFSFTSPQPLLSVTHPHPPPKKAGTGGSGEGSWKGFG